MNFYGIVAASFSVGARTSATLRNSKRLASLLILFGLLTFVLGCGLIGGGGDDEVLADSDEAENFSGEDREGGEGEVTEGNADVQAEGDPQAEARAAIAANEAAAAAEAAAADTAAADTAASEAAAAAEATADPETDADPEAEAAASSSVPALGFVQDAQLARDLTWVHLSQCVTLSSVELAATLINVEWYVANSDQATRTYGLWKVDPVTGAVTPHDILSRQWQAALDSQCTPESLEAIVMPAQLQGPVIVDGTNAVATVWSFLSRCFPNLSKEIFEATHDPAQGEWVVVTTVDSGQKFGTWKVQGLSGELTPFAGLAQAWDSTVKLECSEEALAALVSPTPVPTLPPVVTDITKAVTNLWAHLVKCTPSMTVDDWAATWNSVNDEWVIVTKPAVTVDYGVWVVRQDGSIIPENREHGGWSGRVLNLAACVALVLASGRQPDQLRALRCHYVGTA